MRLKDYGPADRPAWHIAGGGMGGDSWFWVVTVGHGRKRRAIADGRALSATAARDAAAAASREWEASDAR
jgi:hypothetical protein